MPSTTTNVTGERMQPDAILKHFLVSPSSRAPLRIGILLDSLTLPRCFEQVIDHIQKSNFASLELLMMHTPASLPEARPRRSKWRVLRDMLSDAKLRTKIGYTLYSKFDERYFVGANDPLAEIDCTDRLSGIETIKITPMVKGFVHRFVPADIEEIRKRDLDVILRFGFNILRGDILKAARYGVWSYHHGDNDFYRGGPPYLWELCERNDLCGVILQRLNEELDAGFVLAKGIFPTVPASVSRVQNRFTPYWGSVHFVIQKLYELHNYGWEHLERHSVPSKPYGGRRKIYRTPANWELASWLAPAVAAKGARRAVRAFTRESIWRWQLGIRVNSQHELYKGKEADRSGFNWLEPPEGHFHADPFLIEDKGRIWMFFEDYVYCESKAAIACREVLPNGTVGESQTVLRRPYHLSYPFVFRDRDTFYMIPESVENRTVELYRATNFPYEWTPVKVLFRGKAVDTTTVMDDGIFWFFTTIQAEAGDGMCLCLFHSERVDGEWNWHLASPISMDVRDARCGGRILSQNGKLIRVAQDCSGHYGRSFSFREIVTLTKTDYRESLLGKVEPWSKSFFGTHTYANCCGVEVIDGVTHAAKSRHMVRAKPVEAHQGDLGDSSSAERSEWRAGGKDANDGVRK